MLKIKRCLFLAAALLYANLCIGQWVEHDMPEDGSLVNFALNGNTLYAAGWEFALRSEDGIHWDTIPAISFDHANQTCRVQVDNGVVYLRRSAGIGLYIKSIDDGITWDTIPLVDDIGGKVLASNGRIFKITGHQLFKTDNDGQSWELSTAINFGEIISDITAWDGKLYMASYGVVQVSEDNGDTWLPIPNTPGNGGDTFLDFKFYPCGDQLFLSHGFTELYRTNDGTTWQVLPPTADTIWQVSAMIKYNGKVFCSNPSSLLVSTDDGDTWTSTSGDCPSYSYDFIPYQNSLYVATYFGLFKSNDEGESWFSSRIGWYGINEASDIVSFGGRLLLATYVGIYHSSDNGETWQFAKSVYTTLGKFNPAGSAIIYGRSYDRSLISHDGGVSWQPLHLPSPGLTVGRSSFAYGNGRLFFCAPGLSNIWQSLDFGETWEVIPLPFESRGVMAFGQGKLFLSNNAYGNQQVYTSADNGLTWQLDNAGLVSFENALDFSTDGQRVFLTGSDKRYRYIGGTWQDANVYCDFFVFSDDYVMGVSNFAGYTYLSADEGQNWTNIGESNPLIGIPLVSVNITGVHNNDLYVWGVSTRFANDHALWHYNLESFEGNVKKGVVFRDTNADGIQNNQEEGFPYVVLSTLPESVHTLSELSGNYTFLLAHVGDTIRPNLTLPYLASQPPFHIVTQQEQGYDFAITPTTIVNDLSLDMVNHTAFRAGFPTIVTVKVSNSGTEAASSQFRLIKSSFLVFENASQNPSFILGDTLVWNLASLLPLESHQFILTFRAPASTALGTPVELSGTLLLNGNSDYNPTDNIVNIESLVVGSFDPNDKSCSIADMTPLEALDGEHLVYTVRFQNTGNFPADFVRIVDTLSFHLDVANLRLLSASHPATYSLLPGNILDVFFENIQLPDSTSDEPGSHGYVQFSIPTVPGLIAGEGASNRAAIYFDYNAPVITNTVATQVIKPVYINEDSLTLCYGDIFNGAPQYDSYTAVATVSSPFVDSITYTYVTVLPLVSSQSQISVCPNELPLTIEGQVLSSPGQYQVRIPGIIGCDTILDLELMVKPSFETNLDTSVLTGSTVLGIVIYSDTSIVQNFVAANGCDSTVSTQVTVMLNGTVQTQEATPSLTVFPNPTSGLLYIEFELNETTAAQLVVYDALGREIVHPAMAKPLQRGKHRTKLDTVDWPDGVYFLQLKTTGAGSYALFYKT